MMARRQRLLAVLIPAVFGCCVGMGAAQTVSAPAARVQKFELPPIEELQATRERPLFNPSRRPPQIVVASEAPPPITEAAALPFELTGIALGDDIRIAILHNKTTNEELRLREGDKVEDWMIESVADRFILLRGDTRRVRVWLFDNAKKPGVNVTRAGEAEESSAAAAPDSAVDQEVLPTAAPSTRMPAMPPPPPPVKRTLRPPAAARNVPGIRPDQRPQVRRN